MIREILIALFTISPYKYLTWVYCVFLIFIISFWIHRDKTKGDDEISA